ncbi:MAG: hypothetical protein AAGF28_07555 [Pseudomonadota bacterium]
MRSRKQSSKSKTQTFGIRLTVDERAELQRRAGEIAVGSYIKAVLFADGAKRRVRGARSPVKDHRMLAEVLGCLGSSRLSESLSRLADAAESGVLQWNDDAPVAIRKACEDIICMRLLLMKALGFQVDLDALSESLSQSFTRAAKHDPDLMPMEDEI